MLTRCPSCQASVLDDDAEVCPFCGSPMDPAKAKGFKLANKPAAAAPSAPKPTKAPPAKPDSTPTRKPASSSSGSRPNTPARPASPTGKDPFAVDPTTLKGVTPLSRKRTPQNPEKIVCPMCDTAGYAPVAASGKDVRCANPKCMVPVFTAPNFAGPEREKVVEPSSTKSTVLLLLGVALLVFGGGFAYWWMNFRVPQQPAAVGGPGPGPGPITPPVTPQPEDPEPETPATATTQGPSADELREQAFSRWPQTLNTVADLPRRMFRYRLAAESYAIAGNLDKAREHLSVIEEAGDSNRFFQIAPLAQILWAELKQGDATAAAQTFERLAPLRDTIPNNGFDPARNVIFWSAAAAQSGQADAAAQFAMTPRSDVAGERLLANLESAAAFTKFDLHADHPWRPVLSWQFPKLAGTVFHLIRHQQSDAARNFASAISDPTARAEAFSIWAEGITEAGISAHDAIQQAVPADSPPAALFVNARAGLRATARGEKELATQLLAKADALAAQLPEASPLDATTAGKLHQIDLQSRATEKLHAAAFAEAAHLAAVLEQPENANRYLWRAVDHIRSSAPPAAQVNARQREFEATGLSGIQQTLSSELGLNGAPAEEAATEFRRRLPQFRTAANDARDQQGQLLAAGISWGLGDAILAEVQKRDSATPEEKIASGSVGGRLWAAFTQAQNHPAAQAIQTAGVGPRDIPRDAGLELAVQPLVDTDKPGEAASQLMANNWQSVPASHRLGVAMRIVSQMIAQDKTSQISTFLRPINLESDRQELYQHWGAQAAAANQAASFLSEVDKSRLSITLLAGAIYGVTQGLDALPLSAAEPTGTNPPPSP